ncbi:MvaI/BcnI family restriction endonuclease [Thermomonas sp.]|jgi:hypothetical protein|uniref:MvaI/BcnI family restriction endonuclease n=1 Tax=Thermomonas sp. TaxID=1971895 RepID=UPI0035B345AE
MGKPLDADRWLSAIDLETMFSMLRDNGAVEVLYKVLPQNANSKNQVYLGGKDPSQFGKIPSGNMTAHVSASRKSGKKEAIFQASLELYWLGQDGRPNLAPEAKLIYYPQYPEVRFSGFLKRARNAPSTLWSKDQRGCEPGRILVLGIGNGRKIMAITLPPESPAAKQIRAGEPREMYGVLNILPMPGDGTSGGFLDLMQQLCRIHRRGWVPSTRLNPQGRLVPCNASNCHGNTLESLLGIKSNGYSQPDFKGWEVKARLVPSIDKPAASVVTLFTPEPSSGIYTDEGVIEFIRRFGYADLMGRDDRMNFGGIYRVDQPAHPRTGLRLTLEGFDAESGRYQTTGSVLLVDADDVVAASWSFAKLMDHWKAKHAQAAFVASQQTLAPERSYRYGRNILLGEGAEFGLLLRAFHAGNVYYDPGIKLEGVFTGTPITKKRSQFRVSTKNLPSLYKTSRSVDACASAGDC